MRQSPSRFVGSRGQIVGTAFGDMFPIRTRRGERLDFRTRRFVEGRGAGGFASEPAISYNSIGKTILGWRSCEATGSTRTTGWWVTWSITPPGSEFEVVKRPEGIEGFVLEPKRWVVERTHAWIGRYRRHARDVEWWPESSESLIKVSMIHLMLKRLKPDIAKKPNPFHFPNKTA